MEKHTVYGITGFNGSLLPRLKPNKLLCFYRPSDFIDLDSTDWTLRAQGDDPSSPTISPLEIYLSDDIYDEVGPHNIELLDEEIFAPNRENLLDLVGGTTTLARANAPKSSLRCYYDLLESIAKARNKGGLLFAELDQAYRDYREHEKLIVKITINEANETAANIFPVNSNYSNRIGEVAIAAARAIDLHEGEKAVSVAPVAGLAVLTRRFRNLTIVSTEPVVKSANGNEIGLLPDGLLVLPTLYGWREIQSATKQRN